MLKTMTWVSLGLTILGALGGLAGGGESGPETAAEVAMLVSVLGTVDSAPVRRAADATGR